MKVGFIGVGTMGRHMAANLQKSGFALVVNYGANKVRFPAPVPVGSRVRMRATLQAVEEIAGGVQLVVVCTFEREGGDKPVCVAETLTRLYGAS